MREMSWGSCVVIWGHAQSFHLLVYIDKNIIVRVILMGLVEVDRMIKNVPEVPFARQKVHLFWIVMEDSICGTLICQKLFARNQVMHN